MYDSTNSPPQNKLVVPIVVGTRPEAIKLVPIIVALRKSPHYEPMVISTGQHNRLVQYIFELAGIKPDVTLWAGSRRANLNERVASVMQRFEDFCVEQFDIDPDVPPSQEDVMAGRHPAAVLVHGDTSSAMAAALSAFHLRIPVMHVEAGLRTGGSNLTPFPEELNRQVISTIAAMHFAPTSANLQNLVRENVPVGQVFVTGNTGIDALHWSSQLQGIRFANPELQALHDGDSRIVVVTAHRRENWGDGLRGIAEGIARLAADQPDVHFVLPVHPNPRVREVLTTRLTGLDNVLLTEPLGYATFARLLGRCDMVITDSGGIQEEAPSLGKPVLVTRETTERTEGLAAGTLRLVGTNPDVIFAEGARLLTSAAAYAEMSEAENPYGDGHAAERVVGALEHLLFGTEPPTQFGPGYSRATIATAAGFKLSRGVELEQLKAAMGETDMRSAELEEIEIADATVPAAESEPSYLIEG
jgi:UDP-N-acetylglucosamine 2-epimerase (non-hydrolysing)